METSPSRNLEASWLNRRSEGVLHNSGMDSARAQQQDSDAAQTPERRDRRDSDASQALPSRRALLRSLLLPIYVPAAIFAVSNTVVAPFLPVWLRSLGASDATVGTTLSMVDIGGTIAGPLAGQGVAKIGTRVAMLSGLISVAMGSTICALSPALPLLMGVLSLQGAGRSLFQVARQTHISAIVPNELRGMARCIQA